MRFDSVKASGWALGGVTGPNVTVSDNLGSATLPSLVAGGAQENIDARTNYTSWSFGGLYALDSDTSFFIRVSRGGRFNADRQILGGNYNADGSLTAQGAATAVNFVTQQEVGVKRRGGVFGVRYTAELTGFRAQLTDNNYDFTRIQYGENPVIANVYHSAGVEFTGSVRYGRFNLYTDLTLLSAGIVESGGVSLPKGASPHALPGVTYLISPSYDAGFGEVGLTIDGQSSTYTNDTTPGSTWYKIPGQTYVNGFIKFRPYHGLEAAINANNLLNTLGYRGSGSVGQPSGGAGYLATSGIFANSAVLGRTITASVSYKF